MPLDAEGPLRDHARYMPKVGTLGLDMMHRTCTVQVNLDFPSEADMVQEDARLAGAAAGGDRAVRQLAVHRGQAQRLSVATAAISGPTPTTHRAGMLPFVFEDGFGFERYVDRCSTCRCISSIATGNTSTSPAQSSATSWRQASRAAGRASRHGRLGGPSDHGLPRGAAEALLEMRGADGGPWRGLCACRRSGRAALRPDGLDAA